MLDFAWTGASALAVGGVMGEVGEDVRRVAPARDRAGTLLGVESDGGNGLGMALGIWCSIGAWTRSARK